MYCTAEEFKTDLKALNDWIEHRKNLRHKLDDANYLRYQKIKSPLDYEVIGYKNKESVRVIKGHNAPPQPDSMWDKVESLDAEIERLKTLINKCTIKIDSINNALEKLPNDVRHYCKLIYVEKQSYETVANRCHLSVSTLYRTINDALKIFELIKE